MAIMDWDRIMSADIDKIANEEETAESYFKMLSAADFKDVDQEASDPKLMLKLFQVSKAVMSMQGLQYDAALEEMEKITEETVTEREKEMMAEINRLQSDLEQYQKHSGSGDRYFRTEIQQLEDRNQKNANEILELERRLLKEQNSYDRMNSDMQSLDKRYQETKRELDKALDDVKEYQRQLTSNREGKGRIGPNELGAVRDEIVKKNREISGFLDEIKNLQISNDSLQDDLDHAKTELKEATDDMNSMTNENSKLKSVLHDTDKLLEGMRKQRDILQSQFQDMQIQVQMKNESEDQIMSALNEKVTMWKDIMSSKDNEVKSKQKEIDDLQKQLQASRLDSDSNTMIKLSESNASKDAQIKNLNEKLQIATKDYEEVTTHINTLKGRTTDGSPTVYQQKRIQKLQETISGDQIKFSKQQLRIEEAEKDVVDKDQQIAELVNKIIQYEQGQYGLSEAVKELKDCRAQIRMRDNNIQDLTQEVNKLFIEINDLGLENEEMRERLGLESREDLDLVAIRKKKTIKDEQAIALNSVLQKEVEKLEEERVVLKKALRQQALDRGERAVQLGLTALDLEPIDNFTIPTREKPRLPHTPVKDGSIKDDEYANEKMEKMVNEIKELKEENYQMEIGLRELNGALRQGVQGTVQIPAMDKMIAIIEQRNATGQYDTNQNLKGEMRHLTGRNEELRSELRNAQIEINNSIVELEKRAQKIKDQENEINILREASETVLKINPLPLPEGVNPTSKEIIACLNEYLIQTLRELSNKEELCLKMQNTLEEMQKNFSVAKHRQGILYKEHFELREAKRKELEINKNERDELLVQKSQDAVRIKEFDKLLHLNMAGENPKKLLAELTRKITVLRVNEKSLTRRYTILIEVEANLRKENSKLRKDMLDMEVAIKVKIGDLEREKEMSSYKVTSLYKQLEDVVPSSELEMANKQFNELTAKYRDVLQRESNLVGRTNALECLQAEIAAYQQTDKTLKEKLHQEKERSYVLEQTLNDLVHKLGKEAEGHQYDNEEIGSLARKLATLEMKELNEKERADHATMKYEQLNRLVSELEKRNGELETKFADIAKLNLECQRVERELRAKLEASVPVELNRVDKELIHKLEESEGALRSESHKLKEIADISQHQVATISLKQVSQEKELTSLRKQLYELQMETDEKTIIAKLHQHIVAMQVSESTAVRKYEVSNKKVSNLELKMMRLQKLVDEKDVALHHLRAEGTSKSRFLKKTIQDLRRQFSGSITLSAQERYNDAMHTAQERKEEYEKKLVEMSQNHLAAEELAVNLKFQNEGLKELIATLKDGEGAKKVAEWHNRMGEIKLENMKLKRQIEMNKERTSYLENIVTKNESSVSMLENDLMKQTKEFEDRQLLWEQHEVELERNIAKLQGQQKELSDAARKFEVATGSCIDDSLPLANQLDVAVSSLKQHIKTIIVTRAECSRISEIKTEVEKKLRTAETSLMQKDKIINELRLRLPFNQRDVSYSQILETPTDKNEDNIEAAQAVKVAQTTIESLKLMLQKKDADVVKYQDMLRKAREELKVQTQGHQQEIKVLQGRLQLETEERVRKMKKVHQDYLNAPQQQIPSNKQIERLVEVEELLTDRDNALGAAALKHDATQDEIRRQKEMAEEKIKVLNETLQQQRKENKMTMQKLAGDMEKVKETVREKEIEIDVLNKELELAREASKKAPSKTMKNLVERLRDQLEKKDKEQKALSHALLQIQSDMVCSAEENVKAYARKVGDEMSVQFQIEKETKELRSQIEDLQSKNDKLKKEMKKKKDAESNLAEELEGMTLDIQRKDTALKELAEGLKGIDDVQSKYDELKKENKRLLEQMKRPVVEPMIQPIKEAFVEHIDMTDLDDKPVKEEKTSAEPSSAPQETKGRESVVRWEESKKWQKKFDAIKAKLKEKLEECEKLNKTNGMLREGVSRQEKDKLALQIKLKTLSRGIIPTEELLGETQAHEETVAGLKQRIFLLEEENNNLTRQLNLDQDREVQELRIQLSQQNESINALESQLMKRQEKEDPEGFIWGMEREKALKKDMLEIRKENMSLLFEKEQASKDGPRLKARVSDQQGYIDVLKSEIEKLKKREKNQKDALGTGMGGQSVEDMERVICAMRRVVERLQVENEALRKDTKKKQPYTDLTKENRTLKQELLKLKQSQPNKKGTALRGNEAHTKLIEENDKLCRDLHQERNDKEELKIEKRSLEARIKKLLEALEEKDEELLNINKPQVNPQKEFMLSKAAHEGKVKLLQNEIEKKNNILKDIKVHLRDAAEREVSLLRHIDELEEKVKYLQDFPLGIQSENDAMKFLQQARLQIKRLEVEKKELTFELERLNKLTNRGETPVDVTQDEILKKLSNYDKMMATEVDLRMKFKMLSADRDQLEVECRRLQEELSAFNQPY